MTKIEVLKNSVSIAESNKKELKAGETLLTEGGQFFPDSYLRKLVSEIEELEERCGEKEPLTYIPAGVYDVPETLIAKSFTISSDKKSIFNFQRDEFGMRFIQR